MCHEVVGHALAPEGGQLHDDGRVERDGVGLVDCLPPFALAVRLPLEVESSTQGGLDDCLAVAHCKAPPHLGKCQAFIA